MLNGNGYEIAKEGWWWVANMVFSVVTYLVLYKLCRKGHLRCALCSY